MVRDWRQAYLDRFYRAAPDWMDGTAEFHRYCAALLPKPGRILEIGSGPSNPTSRFLATRGSVTGIDVDPDVRGNDALAEAFVIRPGERYPVPDASFDLCVSNYVIEHVGDPEQHLREIHRVLSPGGAYAFRAPNLLHYTSLGARLTPHWVHTLLSPRLRNHAADAHEPYPTFYRMNTAPSIRRAARRAGLEVESLKGVEKEPSYGFAARPLFLLLMAYERVVNSTSLLSGLRANFFVTLRRPPA